MRLLALIFCFGLILGSTNSFAQYDFEEFYGIPTVENLYDVQFISADRGWICGDSGLVYRTDNGGDTWVKKSLSGTILTYNDIEFIDINQGWLCGQNGTVLKTTTGGDSWTIMTLAGAGTVDLHSISMIDNMTGWLVGSGASGGEYIWKTSDGGTSWIEIVTGHTVDGLFEVEFMDMSNGWMVGKDIILYTNDGGAMWYPASITGTLPPEMFWEAICMNDPLNGIVVGFEGVVAKTGDGGATWITYIDPISGLHLRDVDIFDGSSTYTSATVGVSGITWVKDFDAGVNEGFSLGGDRLEGVDLVDETTAWVVGEGGRVFRSPVSAGTDLAFVSFNSPTDICGDGSFPIAVTVVNAEIEEITAVTLNVYGAGGTSLLLTSDWTGSLMPGNIMVLNLGSISLDGDEMLTIEIVGDDFTDNNTMLQQIKWSEPLDMGVSSPVHFCTKRTDGVELNAFGGLTYKWVEGTEVIDSTSPNPWVFPEQTTLYHVGIDGPYCFGSFEVRVVVHNGDCLPQTNSFSPNGDGVNDSFILEDLVPGAPSEFYVFNRWGNEVFYIDDYDNQGAVWEGTDGGDLALPSGTYYFVFECADHNISSSGWVQLLR